MDTKKHAELLEDMAKYAPSAREGDMLVAAARKMRALDDRNKVLESMLFDSGRTLRGLSDSIESLMSEEERKPRDVLVVEHLVIGAAKR